MNSKHRAVIIGAGRIGAGYNWHDDAYTHAGAYAAIKDRVDLIGFIEPDHDRAQAASLKWNLPVWKDWLEYTKAEIYDVDMYSVCVQPDQQKAVMEQLYQDDCEKGIYCEKPYVAGSYQSTNELEPMHTQVNYIRRADILHQVLRHVDLREGKLTIWAKDDIHTKCHFDDLRYFWGCQRYEYNVISGPCYYQLEIGDRVIKFNNGGCNGGECMKRMLQNLIDSMEGRDTLWSPAR